MISVLRLCLKSHPSTGGNLSGFNPPGGDSQAKAQAQAFI